MTVQVSDSVDYRGEEYCIAGVDGGRLFDPTEFDVKTFAVTSACWRGFVCEYTVVNQMLLLNSLSINLSEGGSVDVVSAPSLNGRPPFKPKTIFSTRYEDVKLPIPFSGGLLIVRGCINEYYELARWHPAMAHREVHELLFEGGRLTSESDARGPFLRAQAGVTFLFNADMC